jgi:hypothetical protein
MGNGWFEDAIKSFCLHIFVCIYLRRHTSQAHSTDLAPAKLILVIMQMLMRQTRLKMTRYNLVLSNMQ